MGHKPFIDGTAYEITGGKTLIDGTAYSIKSGKTLVDGTAYEVGFVSGIPVTIYLYDNTTDATSTVSSSDVSATIAGETYIDATSGICVQPGEVISLSVTSGSGKTGIASILVNDEVVASVAGASKTATYNYTVPEGVTAITIGLSSLYSQRSIKITTQ